MTVADVKALIEACPLLTRLDVRGNAVRPYVGVTLGELEQQYPRVTLVTDATPVPGMWK